MEKKISPLEAYNRLCSHLDYDNSDYMHNGSYEKDNEIIETALKDYEYLKLVAKPLTDEEKKSINSVARRLKVLEIIKEKKVNVDALIKYIKTNAVDDIPLCWYNEYIALFEEDRCLSQNEFDLLKEVLK